VSGGSGCCRIRTGIPYRFIQCRTQYWSAFACSPGYGDLCLLSTYRSKIHYVDVTRLFSWRRG